VGVGKRICRERVFIISFLYLHFLPPTHDPNSFLFRKSEEKCHINDAGRMGEGTHGNKLDIQQSQLSNPGFGDAAGDFNEESMLLFPTAGGGNFFHVHIVKEYTVNTGSKGFIQLGKIFDLNFHFTQVWRIFPTTTDRILNGTGGANMIFLDKDAVGQRKAVIAAATDPDRVFFKMTHAGGCFPRIEELDVRSFQKGDH